MTLALPDPRSLAVAEAHARCAEIVDWANATNDLKALVETLPWMAAVEEYLSRKNAEGPAQTAARLVEARIGEVLGPAENHGPATVSRDSQLDRWERHDFRLMDERREVWVDELPLSRRRVLRLIRDDEADMRPRMERPVELLSDIREGDFRKVLADIPDESIDLILTDPPYPKEFLPLWSDLALLAKRVLTPTGMLAAMSGQVHLPEVYHRLGEHLPYRWTMAYLMNGAANVVHARRVSTMWKPIIVYGSTQHRFYDVVRSDAKSGPVRPTQETDQTGDKRFHGWGQTESGFYDLLQQLAAPGQTVLDPFLGGGTTAVVSAAYGCHFIGCDVDPRAVAAVVRRIAA